VPKQITALSISNFRSFDHLDVSDLGGVTLITGKNNAGKSTFLEAIRLLISDGSPSVFYNILNYREESDNRQEDSAPAVTPEDFSSFCSLFTNYPSLAECGTPFSISATDRAGTPKFNLTARIGWFAEKTDVQDGVRRLVPAEDDLFGESAGFPALEIDNLNRKRVIRIDRPMRYRRTLGDPADTAPMPCVYLDPFSSRSTGQLANMWDAVVLTSAESDVVKVLRVASPDIEAVNMIGGESSSARSRTAIVKSSKYSHPVPLRSFGDGVNRLFGLMLSLSCAKNGVLLVDEIENGLHYTILPNVWRIIFQLASQLNVQIFATTHSWDCIKAFQHAAAENADEGALLKLAARDGHIMPTIFKESELAIATRDQIELR
jgi:predicted ATPase